MKFNHDTSDDMKIKLLQQSEWSKHVVLSKIIDLVNKGLDKGEIATWLRDKIIHEISGVTM